MIRKVDTAKAPRLVLKVCASRIVCDPEGDRTPPLALGLAPPETVGLVGVPEGAADGVEGVEPVSVALQSAMPSETRSFAALMK